MITVRAGVCGARTPACRVDIHVDILAVFAPLSLDIDDDDRERNESKHE
jgi:hypothetical protein